MYVHLIALALAGCTSEGDGSASGDTGPDLPPAAELGTGDITFVPLVDGDPVDVIFGPQGGYHFNVSLRVQGIWPGNPTDIDDVDNPVVAFHAYVDGESVELQPGASTYKQGIDAVPGEPGVYQMIGRRLLLNITNDDQLDGVETLIDVDVTDRDGVTLHDERTIVAVPSPFNNDG
ncbi:MAG: hypothetical protein ABMA64_09390 [Myxococcota bacterium]